MKNQEVGVRSGLLTAFEMKAAFDALTPLIEEFTSVHCPRCQSICCAERHGRYEETDLLFLRTLGHRPPEPDADRKDDEPCRHIGAGGCSLPRYQRPFRCTWFFCTTLLEEMPRETPRRYRRLVSALQRLQEARMAFMEHAQVGRIALTCAERRG